MRLGEQKKNKYNFRWSEQLDRIKKTNNRTNGAPAIKKRNKRLHISNSFHRSSSSADTTSVFSTNSVSSKKSLGFRNRPPTAESDINLWTAPTFLQYEIELPKDLSTTVLKSGRNLLDDSKDPFRMLGPLKYFNARKRWSEAYTVQLVRDEKVVYGFSIQGTGPVEILGVDANTPASDNCMRTGDLVVGINGMDARFMTHNEAVAAIRFGAEGYDQAIQAQASAAGGDDDSEEADKPLVSFPPEVDVVQLTMIRPLAPMQQPTARKQSAYLELPRDQTPSTTPPHRSNPLCPLTANLIERNNKKTLNILDVIAFVSIEIKAETQVAQADFSAKHCFSAQLRPLRKSVSSLVPSSSNSSENRFFGLSAKLRKKSSSLNSPDAVTKYRGPTARSVIINLWDLTVALEAFDPAVTSRLLPSSQWDLNIVLSPFSRTSPLCSNLSQFSPTPSYFNCCYTIDFGQHSNLNILLDSGPWLSTASCQPLALTPIMGTSVVVTPMNLITR
ncbi:hypothetical protein ACTXT7_006481 [Hymenolepis weldensis]